MTEQEIRQDERRRLADRIRMISIVSCTSSAYTGSLGQDAAVQKFKEQVMRIVQ